MAKSNGTGSGTANHPFEVTFVVAGDDVKAQVKPNDVVGEALEKALKKSSNKGQPVDKWLVKDDQGGAVDKASTFAAAGIVPGSLLFATLSAGAAG